MFGCEIYFTPTLSSLKNQNQNDTISSEDKIKKNIPTHLLLLAKNSDGFDNLSKLVKESYNYIYNNKPIVDFQVLKKYSDHLIATNSCKNNIFVEIYHEYKKNGHEIVLNEMRKVLKNFLDIFKNNWYGELQWNDSTNQYISNYYIILLAKEYNFQVISTVNAHSPKLKDINFINCFFDKKDEEIDVDLNQRFYSKNAIEMLEDYKKYSSSFPEILYDDEFISNSISLTEKIVEDEIKKFIPKEYSYVNNISIGLSKNINTLNNYTFYDELTSFQKIMQLEMNPEQLDIIASLEKKNIVSIAEIIKKSQKSDFESFICWGIPVKVLQKEAKKQKQYLLVKVVGPDDQFVWIKCWNIQENDKINVYNPYFIKIDYSKQWGFSTANRTIGQSWKMLEKLILNEN